MRLGCTSSPTGSSVACSKFAGGGHSKLMYNSSDVMLRITTGVFTSTAVQKYTLGMAEKKHPSVSHLQGFMEYQLYLLSRFLPF